MQSAGHLPRLDPSILALFSYMSSSTSTRRRISGSGCCRSAVPAVSDS